MLWGGHERPSWMAGQKAQLSTRGNMEAQLCSRIRQESFALVEEKGKMGKKRKHSEANVAEPPKKESDAPERPKRTLLGWKDPTPTETKETESSSPIFRNKEKVLVTCSRRISYRSSLFPLFSASPPFFLNNFHSIYWPVVALFFIGIAIWCWV